MMRKYWFYASLIHSEHIEDHEIVDTKVDEMRKEIEAYTGTRDPARDTKEEDDKDTSLLARLIGPLGGPPDDPNVTFSDFMYWIFRIIDAHTPIVKKYGRYPRSDRLMGREDIQTEEEKEYLKKNEELRMPKSAFTDEEARIIAEMVKEGRWDPLEDQGPPGDK